MNHSSAVTHAAIAHGANKMAALFGAMNRASNLLSRKKTRNAAEKFKSFCGFATGCVNIT